MPENRFLQSPLAPSEMVERTLDLPELPRVEPETRAPEVSRTAKALSTTGLMPPQDLQPKFESAAANYGVPVNVLAALAAQESGYNSEAIGQQTKWGRAKGMLQYIDPTAKGMGINPFNAEQSIEAAAKQLRERLDKGDTMEEAVMAHFGGDNREQWGPKTREYGQEVLGKAGIIGKGLMEQQPAKAAQPAQEAPTYDLKSIQSELDAKEAGRFKVLTPEEAAAIQAKAAGKPATAAPASDGGPDDFLSATGKALKNVPQNFKNSAGGLIRSIGEGIDDQSLVVQAKQAGILDQMQGSGDLVFKSDSPGGKARPYLKDGSFADTATLAAYIRKNASGLLPSDDAAAGMTGMQPGAVSKYGADLSGEARKDMVEVNPDGPLAKYGSMIIGSTAEMIPALTASVLARSPQPMMAIMGGQVYGQSYDKAREKGMDAQQAGGYATAQAVAEAIPEALPLHFILKPGQQFFKGLLTAGAAESLQEGVTQAIQSGIDKGTLDPNMTWGQAAEQIRDAMIVGAGSGGLMRAGVHGVEKLTGRGAAPAEPVPQEQPVPQDRVEPTVGDEQAAAPTGEPQQSQAPGPDQTSPNPAPAPTNGVDVQIIHDTPAPPPGPLTSAAAQMDPAELAKIQQGVVDAAAKEQAGTDAAPEAKPAGEPVTVRGSDGEMPGTLESYQEDGKGGWTARVMAEDGNAYEFTQDDGVTLDRAATPPTEATNDAQTDTAQNGLPEGDATEVPGAPVRPAPAERIELATATVPELRAELKAVAAELRGDRSNAELKARRKDIEKAINGAVETAIADPATAAKHVEPKAEKLSAEELAAVGAENQRGRDEQAKRAEDYQKWKADYDQRQSGAASAVDALEGEKINRAWSKFSPDSGSLNVPRADMPQIKAEHRGAMTQFLNARGIQHTQEEVPASSLKPTQEEFSPAKVKKALGFTGGDRAILVSSDGHILDGHHQWLAKVDGDQPVKVIRLDAPIKQLLDTVREFPSAGQSSGAVQSVVDATEAAKTVSKPGETALDAPISASEVAEPASARAKPLPQIKADLSGLGDVPSSRKQAAKKAAWAKAYRDTVGLQEGDSFTPSGDIGYASGGKTYTIERIGVDGSFSVNAENGSGTIISRAEMQRARTQGVDLRKVETKPGEPAAEQVAPESPAKPEVSKNVLVSDDRAAELRQRLKGKLSQLNSGIDPEIVAIGTELAVYHIERGARTFAAYAKAIAADLGTTVQALRPYLRSWYNGSRDMMEDGGHSIDGMDSAETVRSELAKIDSPTAEVSQGDATPAQQRATQTVTTPAGREFDVRAKVIEADDLVTSNRADGSVNPDYPQDLQPRDRSRSASLDQINDIASKLNPRLLGESASATDGAPIVSPEGVVESGNGRTLSIQQAYARHPEVAAKYREWLKGQGFDVDGMKNPVMVRERVTPMDASELQAYTQEANERTTLAMSSTERAVSDAKKIGGILHLYRGGDVSSAANRDFVRGFMGDVVAKSDRGAVMDADGMLSQDGRRRIEAGLLAAAYNDDAIVSDLFESADTDIKSIGGALLDASGEWAQMRQEAKDGTIPAGVDITPNLMEAVNLVRRARAEGRPVFELVNQSDIFSGDLSQTTKDLVAVFYRGDSLSRARSRDKVSGALLSYTQQARAAKPGDNLFGDPELTGTDVLRGVNDKLQQQEDTGGQASLFGGASNSPERPGPTGREGQRPRTGAQGEEGQARDDGYTVSFAGWVDGAGPKGTQKQEITMRSPAGDRAGRINLYREPNGDYDLSDIWVSEDHRRKGVATRMLDAVFTDTGAPFIRLSTGTSGDGTALTEKYGEIKIDGRRVIDRPARLGEALNAPSSRSGVEQDRGNAAPAKPVDADPVRDAAGKADRSARDAGESARAERDTGQRDNRLPDDGAVADRARGDQLVHQPDGQFRSEDGAARGSERAGSGRDSEPGTATEQGRAGAIVETAPAADSSDVAKRVEAQRKAANVKTKRGDKANIDEALPLLLPPQREDVLKAEIRHAIGNGMLFTNGTGTGKTASGLGVAKRFIGEGKDNIIVVVPSDKIASDWVKFAGMMGIELKQLTDTRDNGGSGPVITSYANFGANETLAQRQWDLAMADESHYLSSNEAGESTGALEQFRALTGHHEGFYKHVRDANPKEWKAYREAMNASRDAEKDTGTTATQKAALEEAQTKAKKVWDAIEQPARKAWNDRWAKQEGLPKSVFLSATPFPYVKNIDYAEGYLFHYTDPASLLKSEGQGGGYNVGDARQKFLMQHFGYRMRTNKLTAPEAGVDSELMEQNFNQWLKDSGSLSGRRLEVEHDYDRKFATVDDAVGQKIDEGLKFLREEGEGKYREAYDAVSKQFDYQRRQYLLEAIKARAAVPIIKEHMALGRKVVVFHDFNKGGGFDPFDASNIVDEKARAQAKEAFAARPDLFKLDLKGLSSPIDTLGAAFPDALFFNGTVPKRLRRENADSFNDDSGDKHLIVVQSDAGREGVSLHDTSGKHQRVEINLGMPGKPVAAIQIEGRIYRTGQASDAIFRYLTTGTAWEASAFASKIAERASTAENLALGTDARGLKQSFIDAYNSADVMTASLEDGKGGKAYDRNMATGAQLSGFQKAKTYYFAQQKNSRRRDQREGVDYFATPEPVGFKMAEWANINQGDKVLEPSAGHGAIARFFPARTDVTMVEPSYELSQRAALANGAARIVNDRFEDLHLTNKYDAVVMNPPYGSGGKTAIEHVAKAAKHLRDGGRVVALIPRGGLADKRLETFLASEDAANLHMVADIQMPASTFERAGTAVNTHVIVLERHDNPDDAAGIQQRNIDLSNAENVGELFDRIEELGLPDRKPSSKPEPREEIVEHTTGKGKVLRGVVRTGLTKDEALEIDPYTFPKKNGDGKSGWFIRAKYLDDGAKQSIDAYRGFDVDLEGAKFSVQPDGLRSLVEAEPLDLNVSPDLAARPLAEVRAEGFAGMLANRGATMSNPAVGTITFNRAGITKSRSTSNDPAKVLTLANLDEIVSEAAYLGRSEPEGDGGNVVRYHYLGRRLNVDGEPMMAMITLRENADGKISYYNHSMLQDAPSIESITSESASNDNAKYQRPPLRMQRMSLADGTTATPGQSGRIRDTLTGSDLGKAVSRLLADGRVVLHDTAQSLPASSFPGTQALTLPDGTIHLVAENLTPSSAMPVLLHEMFHSGGESLVGSKRWSDLQGRLESLHRQFEKSPGKAGQFFQEARQRVQDAQRAGNSMSEALSAEEFGAYAIEQYDRAPASIRKWVDDVVGAIKEFLFRRFGIQLGQISPAQLRAMSVQALRQDSVGQTDTDIRYSVKPSEHFKDLNAAQKTFLDKIGPERLPQKLKDRWSQLTDNLALRVRQAGVDRYAALLRNDQLLHGEDTLEGSIASSSWVLARMSPSAGGAVSALLNNGRIYLDTKEKVIDIKEGSEGLGATLRKLGSPQEIDRFMGWIAANRSKRLFAEGRENLFTAEEIEAGIKLSGGKLENGKSRSLLYAQAWKEFQQHRDDVLGIAEATGIITPEQRETWSEEFYVPFYRVTDEDSVGGPSSGSGLSRQQAYKKLKGGKQHLNDLLDNTLLNFHHLLQASLKNQAAAQAMVNAKALGIASETTENKRDKRMSTFVMVDGEKQWYDVNDLLTFKAVSALADAGLNNPAMRIGRAFKRFFTNMTTITPQFVVANAIRDTLAAMATSPTSFVPMKTAFKGALTYGNDTAKARMMASGGAFSFGHVYGQNSNELKASLTQSMRGAKVLSDPKLIPGALLGAWRKYHAVTDFAENMNRAGIWEHNLHKGKLKAGFEARDLMDFSAHGDAAIVRILTDLVPFMNARIQGLDKLYRSGAKPAIKTLFGKGTTSDKQAFGRFMAVVGTLTLMSAALYLRNKDDEDYRKLEDWQRDTYWPIKIGDSMFFIPKPFEVGSIATMGERLLEQFVDPTVGGDKLASRAAHMIGDTFAFNPIPQVVKPLYELGANENTFTGRPIEDQSMQKLSPSLRSRPETSRLADVTSRGIEAALDTVGGKNAALSPVQIDHLIQGYTGAVGATAVGMADTIWRRASGEELPARRWSEYQPIKRFYKDLTQEDNYTRYGTDFYSALKKVDQDYADFQHLVKFGQDERALELSKGKGDELALRGSLVKVSKSMSKINMEMKRVQMDKEMSGEGKRLELDRLRGMRNLITEEVGKQLEQDKMAKRASGKP